MASWWISAVVALLSLQVSLSHAFAGCKLDVGFLIDGSGSIGRSGFSQEIGFVKNMVSQLDVSSASSHVSVVTFESSARIVNFFNEISGYSKQHLFAKMNSIPYRGGGTNTEAALNLARTAMFTSSRGARAKCNKVLVVFTDGRSASGVSRVNTAAEKLKNMGIKIISIGVGRSISSSELHAMASSRSHVFTVSSAYALNHILNKVKSELCRETTCWQVTCEYAVWSSWSSSCGQAKRQRALKKRSFAMKKVMGGCAAYSSSCPDTAEAKNLGTCPVCKLDIGFLLDESGSIGSSGFRQELHFVKNIATQLAVSSSNTHVSVMTFSSDAIMRNYFRDATSQSQYHLERLVNSIRYRGGGTDTERALNLARTVMFQQSYGARTGINKILIVFTDGRSASGVTRVRAAAQKIQDMGINIISIGVGRSIDLNELNSMASGPISAHVFRVSSASLLTSIVSKVKEESCKAVICTYAECTYSQWGAWGRTCGDATRQRQQLKITMRTKQAVGGCAGLSKTCHKTQEQKNLGVCLQNCKYAECSWGSWGSWSSSCGYGVRSRKIVTTFKYVKRASCNGLTSQCRSNTQHNVRNTYCDYVECYWGSWGAWSTTCGYGKRSREIASRKKTINRNGCSGLQQTCSSNKQYNARNQLCSCPYVACSWGSWGAWSTTCGDGVRSRKYVATKKTISRAGCSGLPQTCSSRPDQTSRRTYCSCPYVLCSWGSWSTWSTSCGHSVRSRKQVPYKRTVNRINCSGLPQTCSSTPQESKRTSNCKCNYVECKTGSWGSWNTPCGKGSRTRTIQAVRKTVYKLDCAGLTTSCASLKTSESRATLCTCHFVECNYGPWSSWTTSCGAGERARKMIATSKTVQRASCSGLPKTCSKATDVDKRTKLCTCNYVECNYGPWSSWTTSCGAGERARKMIATSKTVQKASCSGLPKSCSTAKDVDKRTKLCTCNYVECNYGPWSSWTTSCGAGERARKMIATSKTAQRASCSGLPKTCSTATDVDKRTKLCTCDYVECNYGPWSSWTTSCGAGERARKMIATSKTVQKASCSGLPKSCSTAKDVDKRTKLCTCNYVECNYGPWSSWTTSCGAGERARKMIATSKTAQRASCSGLPKTCSTATDVDKRTKLCTCDYVECNYGPWSSWTTSCGAGERARKMIETSKTVQRASCSGLPKTCSTATDVDKRTKLCTCNYVECNYGPWSSWTTSCGAGERARKMIETSKTVQRASCSDLPKTCSTATDVDKRTKLCTCNYVECNYGSWSSWTTSCGAGERARKMIATSKTVQRASCSGLPKTCSTATDVDKRTKLCTCNYVECNYGSWSSWTTSCGAGERARKMIETSKTVQRASCSGLPKTCSTAKDVDKRTKLCTCNYVECNYGSWSSWTTSCGAGERARKMIATSKTAQRASCSGLPKTCSTAKDVDKRTKLCTCNYVECNYGPWSSWTTSCGAGERARKMIETPKTAQNESCSGFPKTCSTATDVDKRTKLCTCNYVECNYGPWSSWTTSCGAGERARKMIETSKTVQRASCSDLPKTCSTATDVDKRTKLCTCNYVECNYGSWSSWTTSCGAGERARKMIATSKTVQRASCSGLPKTCSTATDVDKRTKLCTCNYVECNYGSWSSWTTSCGAGERARKMIETSKTVQRASCSGLPKTCSTAKDVDKRTKLCTCNYVECNYGSWSSWTTSCGAGERARKMIETSKTVQRASCSGLPKTCSTAKDVDKRTKLCTCNYVECNYGPWSSWTTSCGAGERARKMIETPKTAQNESCSGFPKTCSTAVDVDKRTKLCQCQTVRCQPSEWSQWSATCGQARRTVRIVTIPVTVERQSCDQLPTKCDKSQEVQQVTKDKCKQQGRDTNCTVNFKSLGCYKDDMKSPRPMAEMLFTERDRTDPAWNGNEVDWENWDTYRMKLICRCAEKAKSKKYVFFGLQFFGECWSGPEAGGTYMRNGPREPGKCLKEKYAPCVAGDKYCIGIKATNFVYQITV